MSKDYAKECKCWLVYIENNILTGAGKHLCFFSFKLSREIPLGFFSPPFKPLIGRKAQVQDIPCCTGCPQEPDETSTRLQKIWFALGHQWGLQSWKVFSSIFIQVELGLLPMFFPDGTWSYKSLQVIGSKLLCSVFTAVAGVAALTVAVGTPSWAPTM